MNCLLTVNMGYNGHGWKFAISINGDILIMVGRVIVLEGMLEEYMS